jgi:hypothetical protein
MKFVCLVYADEAVLRTLSARETWRLEAECRAYGEMLGQRGICLARQELQSAETATTLHLRNGKVTLVDGPVAATAEQLAGFYLIEAPGRHEALHLAADIPPARIGSIEVRPVRELAVEDRTASEGDTARRRAASARWTN